MEAAKRDHPSIINVCLWCKSQHSTTSRPPSVESRTENTDARQGLNSLIMSLDHIEHSRSYGPKKGTNDRSPKHFWIGLGFLETLFVPCERTISITSNQTSILIVNHRSIPLQLVDEVTATPQLKGFERRSSKCKVVGDNTMCCNVAHNSFHGSCVWEARVLRLLQCRR